MIKTVLLYLEPKRKKKVWKKRKEKKRREERHSGRGIRGRVGDEGERVAVVARKGLELVADMILKVAKEGELGVDAINELRELLGMDLSERHDL